jgi:Zn-dependent protease with chaperone function
MDFFGAQEAAKKRTSLAILIFCLGILVMVAAVFASYEMAMHYRSGNVLRAPIDFFDLRTLLWCTLGTFAVIFGGAAYKISSLSGGGTAVAESIGARIIDHNTTDEKERILLNVVEEMAIASGYKMPQVGVLDNEQGINAFAAAITPEDAVVVVTTGALDQLSRDELQCVVGHEFSHLLHGDSRLNIHLAGWIWGLFILFIIGRLVLNMSNVSGTQRDSERRSNGVPFLLFGIALMIIGSIGFLFGRIIQALISRQREYLADASAVQFTRNAPSMVTALARVGMGSKMEHHQASGLAHFFFAPSGFSGGSFDLLATHPPMEARMKAIDKNYQKLLPTISKSPEESDNS